MLKKIFASTRNLPGGKGQLACKADSFTAICEPTLQNVGASISHNPVGLHGLLQGQLYLFFFIIIYTKVHKASYNLMSIKIYTIFNY
jgi:hypothetical protein